MPEQPDNPQDESQDERRRPGPEPERLKLDMDWEEAAEKLMRKKRPPEGWSASKGDDAPEPDAPTDDAP